MSQTKNTFKRMMHLSLLASMGFAALLLVSAPALAQVLGDAYSFAILGGAGVSANGPMSTINGDVGIAPAAGTFITGFPAHATVTPPFTNHGNDAFAIAARGATTTLYNFLAAALPDGALLATLNGQSVVPGTYTIGAALLTNAAQPFTLNGAGTYIFQVSSSLTADVGSGSNIVLNGVDPCNVFWQVTSLATLNGTTFPGTVVAQAGVHLGSDASLTGRALVADAGDVTMAGGNTVGGCSAAVLATTTLSRSVPLPGGTVGAAISDTKTLSSSDGTSPTGTITFYLYGPNDDFCTLGAIFTSPPVTVNGTGDYVSDPYTPTAAGTYRWIAAYSGDGSNAASATACNDANESVVVTVPSPVALPTLNEWGVIIFMLLVGLMSIYYLRRQKAQA